LPPGACPFAHGEHELRTVDLSAIDNEATFKAPRAAMPTTQPLDMACISPPPTHEVGMYKAPGEEWSSSMSTTPSDARSVTSLSEVGSPKPFRELQLQPPPSKLQSLDWTQDCDTTDDEDGMCSWRSFTPSDFASNASPSAFEGMPAHTWDSRVKDFMTTAVDSIRSKILESPSSAVTPEDIEHALYQAMPECYMD